MRKRIIEAQGQAGAPGPGHWLGLDSIAEAVISSEEPGRPVEAALGAEDGPGWRAAAPGPQTIELHFERPQRLRRIWLAFREDEQPRTQEFVLRWSSDQGRSFHEILRQQYTFSPPGTVEQREDYQVDLAGVTVLALEIRPDIGGGPARASLAALRLANSGAQNP